MNIIAVIPARGGSKSIPRKNVKLLGKLPLIAYPIKLALQSKYVNKVIVSTDDEEIAQVAKEYGAQVPFLRPKHLADDEIPTLPVLQHAVMHLQQNGFQPDIVALLYPTSPFLRLDTVDEALSRLIEGRVNSVISVEEDWGRFWSLQGCGYRPLHPGERVNRQYYKPLYRENGAIYFSRTHVLMEMNGVVDDDSIDFVKMQPGELIDIDTPDDWLQAEKIMERI